MSTAAEQTGERSAQGAINACRSARSARGLRVEPVRYALSMRVAAPHRARRRIARRGRARRGALVAIRLAAEIRRIDLTATVRARRESDNGLCGIGGGVGFSIRLGGAVRGEIGRGEILGGVGGWARIRVPKTVAPGAAAARHPDQHLHAAYGQRDEAEARVSAHAAHGPHRMYQSSKRRTWVPAWSSRSVPLDGTARVQVTEKGMKGDATGAAAPVTSGLALV